jgi:hypothetical protein
MASILPGHTIVVTLWNKDSEDYPVNSEIETDPHHGVAVPGNMVDMIHSRFWYPKNPSMRSTMQKPKFTLMRDFPYLTGCCEGCANQWARCLCRIGSSRARPPAWPCLIYLSPRKSHDRVRRSLAPLFEPQPPPSLLANRLLRNGSASTTLKGSLRPASVHPLAGASARQGGQAAESLLERGEGRGP